ncbi:phosphatidylglycerol/phosphatidylinositol transfer protein precursor [Mucor ambiguus]|uniref:Phosphatidylglycerol/phosphatidylinositol transfer protein n=1 Tax=Mucor ambiguus TaxID=91626 RepID=A0A0C9N5G7_9FUNG|nr:phosphatidylglycerol/phosphatidylinositol transfer protein precursor [Mucor ambiguus]
MKFSLTLIALLSSLGVMASTNITESAISPQNLQRTASKTSVHLCGSRQGSFKIDYIKLDPNPPTKGQNLNIEFSGFLEEEVPRYSYIDLSVKLGFFEVLHKQIDLCSEALQNGPSCPVSSGSYHYSTNLMVPSSIPNVGFIVARL